MTDRKPADTLRGEYRRLKDGHRSCPDADELGRYMRGELSGEEQLLLEFHLDTCSACIELTGRLEAAGIPPPATGSDSAAAEAFERVMARKLGFRRPGATPAAWGWLAWLWKVKTPLLLPASAVILLLCLLFYPGMFRTQTAIHPPEMLPVTRVTIDQTAMRAGAGSGEIPPLRAGDVALVTVYLEGYGHPPGRPVRCLVRDAAGADVLSSETAVLEDLSVQVALRLTDPGTYRVRLLDATTGDLLQELSLVVINPDPR